nr:MAG TPA: hypothetical protein [Caudoviricetes sp.]
MCLWDVPIELYNTTDARRFTTSGVCLVLRYG